MRLVEKSLKSQKRIIARSLDTCYYAFYHEILLDFLIKLKV